MSSKDLGFTDKHISSLTGRYNSELRHFYLKQTEAQLQKYEEGLRKLMSETGLKPANISSMMGSAGAKMDLGLKNLTSAPTLLAFKKIQKELDFSSDNLASVFNGAGIHITDAAKQLAQQDSIETLKSLKDELGANTRNISSLLSGSGRHIGKNLDAIRSKEGMESLQQLKTMGFSAKNISSMLTIGGGSDLSEKLDIIREKRPKLEAMLAIYPHAAISSKISNSTGRIRERFDHLYEQALNKIAGEYSPIEGNISAESQGAKRDNGRKL